MTDKISKSDIEYFDSDLFKKRLKKVTNKKYLKDIAPILGIDNPSTFSKNCSGSGLSVRLLLEIAAKFNCSIDYLLGITDKDKKAAARQQDNIKYSDVISIMATLIKSGAIRPDKDHKCLKIQDPILLGLYEYLYDLLPLLDQDSFLDSVLPQYLEKLNNDFDNNAADSKRYDIMNERISAFNDGKISGFNGDKLKILSVVAAENDSLNGVPDSFYRDDIVPGNIPPKF